MKLKLDNEVVTPEDGIRIRAAAEKIMMDVVPLVEGNALHAIGALILAGASAAGYAGFDIKEATELFTTYLKAAVVDSERMDALDLDPKTPSIPVVVVGRGNN